MARRGTRRTKKRKTSKKTLTQRVTALENAIKPKRARISRVKSPMMESMSRDMTPPHIRRQLGL